jgi:hypothetical protein
LCPSFSPSAARAGDADAECDRLLDVKLTPNSAFDERQERPINQAPGWRTQFENASDAMSRSRTAVSSKIEGESFRQSPDNNVGCAVCAGSPKLKSGAGDETVSRDLPPAPRAHWVR